MSASKSGTPDLREKETEKYYRLHESHDNIIKRWMQVAYFATSVGTICLWPKRGVAVIMPIGSDSSEQAKGERASDYGSEMK